MSILFKGHHQPAAVGILLRPKLPTQAPLPTVALITGASRGYGCPGCKKSCEISKKRQEINGEITQEKSNAILRKKQTSTQDPMEIPWKSHELVL